ncbi:MAG: DUF2723 domain-containing protein [Bacteroidia bacterium]
MPVKFPETYTRINNISGWIAFLISFLVYFLCLEPTASYWDCSEYIACAYGIETGHPPGAPFFVLLGRFFSLFAFGNTEHVAFCINMMSALASAFSILFLFWSITHIARKALFAKGGRITGIRTSLIMSAGMAGALAYAFTDSFWFSAVEGEVYALSSFFTALVFWAMLKWEDNAAKKDSDRWLVFIAYMMGLSIGVHLLNLLAIPALVFIWFYRKNRLSGWKLLTVAGLAAMILLGGIQNMLIPGLVKLAGKSELFFVNTVGLPFNSGIWIYFLAMTLAIVCGIFISHKKNLRWLNTLVLSFTALIIGYSSFFIIIIRANAGTPINENRPADAVSLLSYLNREQYGDWPLLYGYQYNSPLDAENPYVDGDPVWVKDSKSGKYIISDDGRKDIPNYDARGLRFFPRMWSSSHAQAYVNWANIQGEQVDFTSKDGKINTVNMPTFSENLRYFISYQCGWMYARYFLWNFAGRQNDFTGYGNDAEGNFASGIHLIDDIRIGDHKLMPDSQKNNKARNYYYFLPLLLGIAGMYWHFRHHPKDFTVVLLLFLFTGLAIVLYLNQTPWQPRERDYAYVGSFYAFAMWIGMGVIPVYFFIRKHLQSSVALMTATVVSGCIPFLLLIQNWDDHNRSGRTVARDAATNMLNSCAPNAILFTYADNDTFPLWFAQEVLGIRRDVRVVCLSLFRSDWYIDQMKQKLYDSDPLPITMNSWDYREGTRDYVNLFEETTDTLSADSIVKFFTSSDPAHCFESTYGETLNYIPTRNIMIPVDKNAVLKSKAVPEFMNAMIEDTIYWRPRGNYLMKDQLIIIDILAHNNWKRPVYFAVNMPSSCYAGLDPYLQLNGMAYRFVPLKNHREGGSLTERPNIHLDKTFDLIMNSFKWGGIEDHDVYADETTQRMFADPLRFVCSKTAVALAEAGRGKEAVQVIRQCMSAIPPGQIAPDTHYPELIAAAYLSGETALANKIAGITYRHCVQSMEWYSSMPRIPGDYSTKRQMLQQICDMAFENNQQSLLNEFQAGFKAFGIKPAADTLE